MTIGMTDGEKVNIEIVEMWFYHSCTYVCMKVNDESVSKNDKLIYTCKMKNVWTYITIMWYKEFKIVHFLYIQ